MNTENYNLLFNLSSTISVQYLQKHLATVTRKMDYELSLTEVTEIYDTRNTILQENHLIDFSLNNTIYLAQMLCHREKRSAKQLMNDLEQLHAIFYYLRSFENERISDEELIERIELVLNHYGDDFEQTMGYSENHPIIVEGEEQWSIE